MIRAVGGDRGGLLAAFEEGHESADIDQNGGVEGGDLALFLQWSEAGFAGDHTLDAQRFLYRGYHWDDALKMYHVRHRVYDPARMLWIQRDPLGRIPGANEYAYCLGEPIDFYDPMGLAREHQEFRGFKDGQRGTYHHYYEEDGEYVYTFFIPDAPPPGGRPPSRVERGYDYVKDAGTGVHARRVLENDPVQVSCTSRVVVLWTKDKPTNLAPNEMTLNLPPVPEWNALPTDEKNERYWERNREMIDEYADNGYRFKDAHVEQKGDEWVLRDGKDSFLRRERDRLKELGYEFDPRTGYWEPPAPTTRQNPPQSNSGSPGRPESSPGAPPPATQSPGNAPATSSPQPTSTSPTQKPATPGSH